MYTRYGIFVSCFFEIEIKSLTRFTVIFSEKQRNIRHELG